MIYIGIDPAFRNDGFAVCVIDEANEVAFKVFRRGIIDFIGWLFHDAPIGAVWAVENSNLQSVLFNRLATKKEAMSVGKNQACSVYTCELIRQHDKKATVFEVSPKDKGKKLTQPQYVQYAQQHGFKPISGTNQDQRDAFKLACIGRTKSRLEAKQTKI